MKLCISQAVTMPRSFAEDLQAYSEAGWKSVEVWFTKFEKHLQLHSVSETKAFVESKQINLVAAAYQGGLLLSQGEARKAAFDLFKQRLLLCQEFEIPTMILVADFLSKVDQTQLERAIVSLTQAAQWASGFGIRLALEFRGADTFCSCLDTTLMLIDQAGEGNLGVALDLFHFYKGPSKSEDLERITKANLFHVQLSDVAGVPRELMTDSDRIMPGEGDFRIEPLMARLREIDYRDAISLELFNPVLWQINAAQVAELGLTSMKALVEPKPI
jgi:2-keto-myo-inositol isomerase